MIITDTNPLQLCDNFSHLVVCRFWLGFVEAAFYPSSVYYLSRWYTRKEIGLRIALYVGVVA